MKKEMPAPLYRSASLFIFKSTITFSQPNIFGLSRCPIFYSNLYVLYCTHIQFFLWNH